MADAEDDPALEQVAVWVCAPALDVSPVQSRDASNPITPLYVDPCPLAMPLGIIDFT